MWTSVEKLHLNSEHTQIMCVIFAILRYGNDNFCNISRKDRFTSISSYMQNARNDKNKTSAV